MARKSSLNNLPKNVNGQKKRSKLWLKLILVLLILAISVIGGYLLTQKLNLFNIRDIKLEQIRNESYGMDSKPVDTDSYQVPANNPRYLSIPDLGVDRARVIALGVLAPDKDGSQQLDAPKNLNDVGWYNCQINPVVDKRCDKPALPGSGDTGTAAMIDGHSCSGHSCVFDNLAALKSDDKIIIELGSGTKVNYTVKEVDVVKLSDVDMTKMMRPIVPDQEGLNLITCAGSWTTTDSRGAPTMNKRVMVFATRE